MASLIAVVREVTPRTWHRLNAHDVSFVAAGLTFYAAIAAVPLMLSALYLAGLVIGEDTVMRLGMGVSAYAPQQLGLRNALEAMGDVGPGLGLASFVAALIPATTYGEGLLRAFRRFTPNDDNDSQAGVSLRGRVMSAVFLAIFPLVTIAGLFAVAAVRDVLGEGLGGQALGLYLAFLFSWASTTIIVATMYGVFGARRFALPPLLWGAGATASFLSGMTLGWLAVLEVGVDVGGAYGGSEILGRAVLFVVYLYLVQLVILVGYVLTLELHRRRRQ